jgi:signal recognition particle GTPase
MGLFSFFGKEKKETLDKGLSKTKESVLSRITRAIAGKSKVDDDVLDNLEEVWSLLMWALKRRSRLLTGFRKESQRIST